MLAGNCGITVGVVAGVAAASGRRVGVVVWLDAHGDFTTPETTGSGFLDGMGLAVLTGRCWTRLAGAVPGHRPVPDEAVVLVGARDFHDPSIAPGNGYAAPDGLTAEQVHGVARTVARRLPLRSATLAAYDPSFDHHDRMRDTALDLLGQLGTLLRAADNAGSGDEDRIPPAE